MEGAGGPGRAVAFVQSTFSVTAAGTPPEIKDTGGAILRFRECAVEWCSLGGAVLVGEPRTVGTTVGVSEWEIGGCVRHCVV